MKFKDKNTINIVLESLFSTYSERVPDVKKITNAMVLKKIVSDQSEIINDHIAFRTMGVKNLDFLTGGSDGGDVRTPQSDQFWQQFSGSSGDENVQ